MSRDVYRWSRIDPLLEKSRSTDIQQNPICGHGRSRRFRKTPNLHRIAMWIPRIVAGIHRIECLMALRPSEFREPRRQVANVFRAKATRKVGRTVSQVNSEPPWHVILPATERKPLMIQPKRGNSPDDGLPQNPPRLSLRWFLIMIAGFASFLSASPVGGPPLVSPWPAS